MSETACSSPGRCCAQVHAGFLGRSVWRTACHAVLVFLLLVPPVSLAVAPVIAPEPEPRLLIIAIDAVPYSVVRSLRAEAPDGAGAFAGFGETAAVVTTFPSISYPAWSGILADFGASTPPGYIGKYFDVASDRVVGISSSRHAHADWPEIFDWKLEGLLRKARAYGSARKGSVRELDDGLKAFLASDQQRFAIYILSTDALGHLHGPEATQAFLRVLDQRLSTLRQQQSARPFHTVLLSDHGMGGGEQLSNIWPRVRAAAREAGFRTGSRLERENDAVFIPMGMLSYFLVHTRSQQTADLLATLVGVDGVDLCVRREQESWQVQDSAGTARIHRRQGATVEWWSYEFVSGDPLGYSAVLDHLRQRAASTEQRWFRDEWWFEATWHHPYPDALHRIAGGFEQVRNPASILCSLDSGFMFAARGPEWLARGTVGAVRWTHGALTRDATLGFLMSDMPGVVNRTAVRFDEALAFLTPVTAPPTTVQAAP